MLLYRSASPGYWTTALLPIALFLHSDSDRSVTLLALIVINTFLLGVFHLFSKDKTSLTPFLQTLKPANVGLSTITVSYYITFGQFPTPYEIFTLVCLNFAFPYVFFAVVKYFPKSFTFGEAVVVTQAFVFIFWSAVKNLPVPPKNLAKASEADVIFMFVQGGFLVVLLACRLLVIAKRPWAFQFSQEFFCIWAKSCLVALSLRLTLDDLVFLYEWVLNFFFVSKNRVVLFGYCITLILAALCVVAWKHYSSEHVTTAYRKYFHFLIVAVYLPAVLTDINLLHISCSAVMYIMLFLEVIRFLNLSIFDIPIGEFIDSQVGIFRDHQDEGRLIVTPIYLLAGCSLPIWLVGLKVSSSELSSEMFAAALSGVLSIGIGDTFASIGGSTFGRTKWKGTYKSIEGTLCSVVSQVIFAIILFYSGMCQLNTPTMFFLFFAIVTNALVEGLTDQIDNLILPLVTFDIILGANWMYKLILRTF